jgi:bla regulator protein blaR1
MCVMTIRQAVRAALSAGVITCSASGQSTPAARKFDVASVKPYSAQDGNFMIRTQPDGTFRAVGVTIKMLVMSAYNVKAFQVSGAPGWAGTDLWEIQAKTDSSGGPPSRADSQARLQGLLQERYQLKVHTERRTMPVYALVRAKSSGTKLTPAASDAQPGICPCGPGSFAPNRASMSMLADQLSTRLWRVVVDKTGIKGEYSFKLEWVPQLNEYGPESYGLPPGLGAAPPQGAATPGPSLSTALKEQLGLSLKSQKGQVEVIVIDHVEKPSGN